MQWLAAVCVKRPVFATVLVLAFVVVGILGYFRLPVDLFPRVDFPTVVVTTSMPGATPQEMETEVTNKIEETVNTISGIDELHSTSSEGLSQVIVTFLLEKDGAVGAQEVRDRVNRILDDLPDAAETPRVQQLDADAAPVLNVAVTADRPVREITEFADKVLRRQLESSRGVGQVNLLGGRARQINIHLDPLRLRAFGLTALDVERALRQQNVQIPAGTVKGDAQQTGLRVEGKFDSVEKLGGLVVKQAEGALVRLYDVAGVEDGEEEPETVARRNGVPAVVLSIRKQSGENTIAVVDALKERLADIGPRLPAGFKLEIVRDNSLVIRTSVHAVKEHLVLGSILAALIVLFFLGNGRATLISALAIPTSIIASFGVMWIANLTLNMISLVALALAVGIVIDDAIIVVENIFHRLQRHREHPHTAAIEGTREIGLAVMATTLSLLAVFVPVAFLSGMVGRFMGSFGLTMSFAIAVSLLVGFTLAPMLSARMLTLKRPGWLERGLEKLVYIFYRPLEIVYLQALRFSMRHRWVVVLACVGAVFAVGPLMGRVQKGLLPANEEAQFQVSMRLPEGTTLASTELTAERVAREIRGIPGVEYTLLTIGDSDQRTPNLASIYVRLVDPAQRGETQEQLMEKVRQQVASKYPPEWRMSVMIVPAFATGQSTANIQYIIAGPELEQLVTASETALKEIRNIPGIRDVDSSLISGKPELTAVVDRVKAGQMGVNISDLSNTLRLLVGGVDVSSYPERGEEYDIHLRASSPHRNREAALGLLSVPSEKGGPVSLSNLVTLDPRTGPSQINHLNRRRQVSLTANNAPGVGEAEILAAIDAVVKKQNLPADYYTGAAGRSKELKRTVGAFITALLMSFIFMYLVLAAQFESWLHPFTILLALPLTLPFALLSLILFGQSLNIFSMLGVLVLFGMVKKNGILQIDHTNQLRAAGLPRLEAILQANRERLRPILMTTAAFVAGMVPMMFAKGIGASMNTTIAGVIIGGQTLSLLLTLLATPVFYSLFDDIAQWRHRRRAKVVATDAEAAGTSEAPLAAATA